jgi:GT2 family glycosyltransferase
LFQNPENAGFARACNQGIAASRGEHVVLINPDTLVERDFFGLLEEFLAGTPEAGIAGPRVIDSNGDLQLSARREVLEEIGPLDERFFIDFEDADLCRRVREAGWRVYYLPHVEVLHLTGASSRSKPRAVWLLHKSAFLYHRKHGPHGPLGIYSLLVLLGLCARAVAKLVLARSR